MAALMASYAERQAAIKHAAEVVRRGNLRGDQAQMGERCRDCGHVPDEDGDCVCVSVEALSLAWEAASGCDSIATIERVYTRSSSDGRRGAYRCCWPGCAFKRIDPEKLWRHIHTAHGENSLPPVDFDPGPWL